MKEACKSWPNCFSPKKCSLGECGSFFFSNHTSMHAKAKRTFACIVYDSRILKCFKLPLKYTIQLLSRWKEPKVYLCHIPVKPRWKKGLFDLVVMLMQRNRFLWRDFYLIPYSRRKWEAWLIWALLAMHKKAKRRGNASPIKYCSRDFQHQLRNFVTAAWKLDWWRAWDKIDHSVDQKMVRSFIKNEIHTRYKTLWRIIVRTQCSRATWPFLSELETFGPQAIIFMCFLMCLKHSKTVDDEILKSM